MKIFGFIKTNYNRQNLSGDHKQFICYHKLLDNQNVGKFLDNWIRHTRALPCPLRFMNSLTKLINNPIWYSIFKILKQS